MKSLNYVLPVLLLLMVLIACKEENPFSDQSDLTSENPEQVLKKKHPVPFHAKFISTVVVFPPQPNPAICGTGFPILHIDQTLAGNATHMGKIIGTISSCGDFSQDPPPVSDVKFHLQAANGDWLYIEDFIVVGGTGRFKGASGSITGNYQEISPGVFDTQLDGEIQY